LLAFGFLEDFANQIMGLAKWYALANQIVGGFGGKQRRNLKQGSGDDSSRNAVVFIAPVAMASMSST